jgi:hypothetical protein
MSNPEHPSVGVRYELALESHDDDHAIYTATVYTAAGDVTVRVRIERNGATIEGDAGALDAAHAAQLVAIAKTIGKRDEAPWPRRVNRWRSPGVR